MFLPGVLLLVFGYALFYSGVSNLTQGVATGGNVQSLTVSLGLDKLLARASGSVPSSGPLTTTPAGAPGADGTPGPINSAGVAA